MSTWGESIAAAPMVENDLLILLVVGLVEDHEIGISLIELVESGENIGEDRANGRERRFLVGDEVVDDSPAVEMGGVGGAPLSEVRDEIWVMSSVGGVG